MVRFLQAEFPFLTLLALLLQNHGVCAETIGIKVFALLL